ncbi:tetraspanin-7-like [Onthophagus taurus]|uniref:tetraspanin-7-like n=1 Tax=Onthophagus taurus TaxID=166361 RepID=UPI000C20A6FC|nr:tetraspanin-7-like [Onthophagus taurus]
MSKHLQTVAAMTCMKTLLMIFNLIFWASGWAILGIGIYMRERLHLYMELTADFSDMTQYVLISTGALIIAISTLACCCTVKGQHVLLYVYGAFLAVAFVLELGTGLSIYAYRERFPAAFDQGLNISMSQYYNSSENNKNSVATAIDTLQEQLHCCGNHGPNDWIEMSKPAPFSCCIEKGCDVGNSEEIYKTGCYDRVVKFINENIGTLAGVAIGITFFPLFGVILSCCLASVINKAKYEQMD